MSKKKKKAEYLHFQFLPLPYVSFHVEKEEIVGNESDDFIRMAPLNTELLNRAVQKAYVYGYVYLLRGTESC